MIIKNFSITVFLILFSSIYYTQICDMERKLVAPDSQPLEILGAANGVDVYGNFAIVGGFGNSEHGYESGVARIFKKEGDQWSHIQKLFSTDISTGDRFGHSVAIYGDYAVVGAPFDDIAGLFSGSVYVYHRVGDYWIQSDKFYPPDGSGTNRFGFEVDIFGDYIVVGAPFDENDDAIITGSAYFYKKEGDDWVFMNKVSPEDGASFDQFGSNIALGDGSVVIGAHDNDGSGDNSGAAYVCALQDSIWIVSQKLIPSNPSLNMSYGYGVSLADDIIVVGAYQDVSNADLIGSAYVYRSIGGEWIEEQKILPTDDLPVISFGISVTTDGDRLCVGTPGASIEGVVGSGANFVYDFNGVNWELQQKLTSDTPHANDYYGTAISMDNSFVITGAFGEDANGGESGAAYIDYLDCQPVCTTISSPADDGASVPLDADVSWFSVEDALGYWVSVGTTDGGVEVVNNQDVGLNNFIDLTANLSVDTDYYVNITPYNAFGDAMGCVQSSFTTTLIPMSLTVGANATVLCHEPIPTEDYITNYQCNEVQVTVENQTIPGDCENQYTLIRTYTATDGCNTATGTQTINVVDIQGPNFNDVPANVWLDCGESLPTDMPTATDACSPSVPVTFEDSNVAACGQIIVRTFSAIDMCGNESTAVQVITIASDDGYPSCSFLEAPQGTDVALNTDLVWTEATNATGYLISVQSVGGDVILSNQAVGNVLTYPLIDLSIATNYIVSVTPYNSMGAALACNEYTFTTTNLPSCVGFSSPAAGATIIPNDATLSWLESTGATGYYLVIGTTLGGVEVLDSLDVGNTTSYTLTLPETSQIYATIIPYNASGTAQECATDLSFTTSVAGGIEEYSDASAILIFPNPNNGQSFQVRVPNSMSNTRLKISVVDAAGRMVSTPIQQLSVGTDPVIRVKLNHILASGVYLLVIQSDVGTFSRKLLVKN